jgi:hypothetical protein
MFKKVLGYLVATVSGAVAVFVGQKTNSPTAGAVAGGMVATAAARLLHLQPPPPPNP